jgi:hypothetical protein
MRGLWLTDWVTIRGNILAVATITQGEACWLDVGHHEDAVFYLDVREVTGASVNLTYQTSPSKDEESFLALYPAVALATGTSTQLALAKYQLVPLARYLRWQIIGSGEPYDATFRIHVAVS